MNKNFFDATLAALLRAKERYGSASALSEATGVDPVNISRWLNGKRKPRVEEIGPILDDIGARIVLPDERADSGGKAGIDAGAEPVEYSREVCFVNARMLASDGDSPPPHPEDYLAVPLVEEVGAGPGIIPQGNFLSWFLVYRHQDAVRYKSDLIAVKVGIRSTSMEPTLHPGDIVLIDRQDKSTLSSGRMMLVMDPDGAGKIKRVAVEQKNNDHRIIYYSDNAAENPPEIYSLREDFYNEWDRAIVGRVLWAWSDVSNK